MKWSPLTRSMVQAADPVGAISASSSFSASSRSIPFRDQSRGQLERVAVGLVVERPLGLGQIEDLLVEPRHLDAGVALVEVDQLLEGGGRQPFARREARPGRRSGRA